MNDKTTMTIFVAASIFAAATSGACAQGEARREWLERIDEARERYDAFAARVTASLERAIAVRAYAPLSEDAYLDDATLRAGDIVVTSQGLLMFKGSPRLPYDSRDFERIGEGRARSLPHRSALLAILRAAARRR